MTTQADASNDDLTKLRAQIADLDRRTSRLEARSPEIAVPRRRAPGPRSHRFWVAVLLALGTLLTPLTLLAVYVKTQVTDTSRYMQTVAPLARDSAVQSYLADRLSAQLLAQVDIQRYVNRALPRSARALDGPLTGALESFTRRAILSALQTDQFAALWVDANRIAHAQLVKVLTGSGDGIVGTANGEVTIDLSRVAGEVKHQLVSSGITVFANVPTDTIGGKITIFRSRDVYRAQQATKLLQTVAFVLPFIVLGCFGGSVALSRDRRRAFVRAAAGFTLGALLLWIGLAIGRTVYLDAATANLPYDAAAALYDTLLRPLQTAVRTAVVFSLVVVVAAFISGPSRVAVRARERMHGAVSWLGTESDHAGLTALASIPFVSHHKTAMRLIPVIAGLLVLFRWVQPTPKVVLGLTLGVLMALGLVEFFGRGSSLPISGSRPNGADLPTASRAGTELDPSHPAHSVVD